eukprot:scaffold112114_cov57-Phaeocystis_antarctica.AAC.1
MVIEEVARGMGRAAVGAALDEKLDKGEVVMYDGKVQADLVGHGNTVQAQHYSLLTTHHSLLTTHHSLLTTHDLPLMVQQTYLPLMVQQTYLPLTPHLAMVQQTYSPRTPHLAMVGLTDVRCVQHIDIGAVDIGRALRREERHAHRNTAIVSRATVSTCVERSGTSSLVRRRCCGELIRNSRCSAVSPTVPRPCTSTWPHVSSESALRQPPTKGTSSGVWAPPDGWGVDSRSPVLLPMLGAPRDVSLLRGLFAWSLCAEAKAPPFCFG